MSALMVEGIEKRFSGVHALRGVSFAAERGQVLGLVGPNGSGKTTLLNVCNGVYRADAGQVSVHGRRITSLRTTSISKHGIARTFQAPRVFDSLTVFQNMRVPLIHTKVGDNEVQAKARSLLTGLGLEEHLDHVAQELSGGQKKLLEFARALVTDPKVVLMDEPFAGVHPHIKERMIEGIRTQQARDVTFLIVSHELPLMTRIVDEMVCLAEGTIISRGAPRDVCADQRVIDAYLGSRRRRGRSEPTEE